VFQWTNEICPKAQAREERVKSRASKRKLEFDTPKAGETETIPVPDVGESVEIGNYDKEMSNSDHYDECTQKQGIESSTQTPAYPMFCIEKLHK
jgi:hypothetical protein